MHVRRLHAHDMSALPHPAPLLHWPRSAPAGQLLLRTRCLQAMMGGVSPVTYTKLAGMLRTYVFRPLGMVGPWASALLPC
jgi:hypothetical protein